MQRSAFMEILPKEHQACLFKEASKHAVVSTLLHISKQ